MELLERHFRQDEMWCALKELEALQVGAPSVHRRNPGIGKMTATRHQALDVVETLKLLSDRANTPRFLVQSDDLPRIAPLLGELSVGDERGVAARLEALEHSHRQGLEKMERLMVSMARGATAPAAPQVIVTPPAPPSFSAAAAAGGGGAGDGGAPRAGPPGRCRPSSPLGGRRAGHRRNNSRWAK